MRVFNFRRFQNDHIGRNFLLFNGDILKALEKHIKQSSFRSIEEHKRSVPNFLCVGFFCHDLHEGGHRLGGTASYSSLMMHRLGGQTAVLTSVGADFGYFQHFEKEGLWVTCKSARLTTVFHNRYQGKDRMQYVYQLANTLTVEDLPDAWRAAPAVLLGSIAREIDDSLLKAFPDALLGATLQGWLRQWDERGQVQSCGMDWEKLSSLDVVMLSDADIQGIDSALSMLIKYVPIVVVTKGGEGASIYAKGEQKHFPAYPVTEVDPTGAGDIFAASFMVKYQQTKDIALSMAYAHAAASHVVEKVGVALPSLKQVDERFADYQLRFF